MFASKLDLKTENLNVMLEEDISVIYYRGIYIKLCRSYKPKKEICGLKEEYLACN